MTMVQRALRGRLFAGHSLKSLDMQAIIRSSLVTYFSYTSRSKSYTTHSTVLQRTESHPSNSGMCPTETSSIKAESNLSQMSE